MIRPEGPRDDAHPLEARGERKLPDDTDLHPGLAHLIATIVASRDDVLLGVDRHSLLGTLRHRCSSLETSRARRRPDDRREQHGELGGVRDIGLLEYPARRLEHLEVEGVADELAVDDGDRVAGHHADEDLVEGQIDDVLGGQLEFLGGHRDDAPHVEAVLGQGTGLVEADAVDRARDVDGPGARAVDLVLLQAVLCDWSKRGSLLFFFVDGLSLFVKRTGHRAIFLGNFGRIRIY